MSPKESAALLAQSVQLAESGFSERSSGQPTSGPRTTRGAVGRPRQILGKASAFMDVLLLILAFMIAYRVRAAFLGEFTDAFQWREHASMLGVSALIWLAVGTWMGLYSGRWRPLREEFTLLTSAMAITAVTTGSLAFLLHLDSLSRTLTVLYIGIGYASAGTFRLLIPSRSRGIGAESHRVVVVGSGPTVEEICRSLLEQRAELVGIIPEDTSAWLPSHLVKLGSMDECEEIFRRQVVDEVIFAVPRKRWAAVEHAFTVAEDLGLETKLALNFLPNRFARIDYEELAGMPMLSFRSAPAHPVQLAFKRVFDVVVSTAAIIIGAPVFLAIAALIKLESPGPIFFGQKRMGLNGRVFTMWKFRSMVVNAEAKMAELRAKNEMNGPVFKIRNDPRVTRIGRFIRKTSLDELPQFWNVLIGEMSVVGPRPPIPSEVKQYERWQRRRLSVAPGLTCLWQISGRNNVDFDQWMRMDLQYIDQWSFWRDLKIFFLTVPAVLFRRGAS